jgi:prolyl-tRNA synthetase
MMRGIEVGNIFQLGTKYSESMNCTYLDVNGKSHPMVMGCYGIGVGRAMASVIEFSHDEYGPIWPMSIAPYQVHVCVLDSNKPGIPEAAEKLVSSLEAAGIEVLVDDRNEKAGFMFNDADLIGIPLRVVLSNRTLGDEEVEFKKRGCKDATRVKIADIAETVKAKVAEELKKFEI